MKATKRILALVLALAMVFALTATAFAEGEPTYTITVNNNNTSISIEGIEFKAYKVFDATYTTAESDTGIVYTIKTDNLYYTTAAAKAILDTYFDFVPTADPTVMNAVAKDTFDATKARKMADDLMAANALLGTAKTATGTSGQKAVIDVGEAGYYVVTGTAKPADPKSTETVTAALALTTANPTGEVNVKTSIPTLDKKITGEHLLDGAGKAATAEVGKTVNFELDSKVPDITSYSDYTFTISDTMSDGLSFTGTDTDNAIDGLAITVGGTSLTAEKYTVAHTVGSKSFTITIPFATLQTLTKDDAIVVTYSAIVNEGALTTDYEKNTAKLTYSNNPYDNTAHNDTPDKTVYVIDVNIDVDKVAENATGSKLANAKFKLFKGASQPADDAAAWYKWDDTNKKVTWVAKAEADEFITNASGNLTTQVRGLEAEKTGTKYGLLETAAPVGYNLLKDAIIVTLTGAYDDTAKTATVTATNATVTNGTVNVNAEQNNNQPVATTQVINKSGAELPSTGGIGTTIFYIVGGILVLGAGVVLIARRRMSADA